jgi:hypothetical protein
LYRVLNEAQNTLVEALEHRRDDLVDLADDFLARCHFECVFGGFEMYEIQIREAECKTDEEKRPLYAVDNLELMMSHDVGFGGESMTMRAAERATSDDD